LWTATEGRGVSPFEFNVSTTEQLIQSLLSANSDKSEFEDGDPILGKFEVLTALTTIVVDMTRNMLCHSCREQAIKMILGLWHSGLARCRKHEGGDGGS